MWRVIVASFATITVAMNGVVGLAMLFTGLLAFLIGDTHGGWVLFGIGLATCAVCTLLRFRFGRPSSSHLAINSAAVAIAWLVISLVATLPIWIIAVTTALPNETLLKHREPLNAWYDAVSSVTTAGLTTTIRSSDLPDSILLWRSVSQWVGGLGVAVFAIKFLDPSEQGRTVYHAETRQWESSSDAHVTIRRVLDCYLILTAACFALFLIGGMSLWEAANHCLVIVSTGGLTVTDQSFAPYHPWIRVVAAAFMISGAFSFAIVRMIMTGKLKAAFRQTTLRATALFFIVILLTIWVLVLVGSPSGGDWWFNTISAMTTCGVSSGDVSALPSVALTVMVIAMITGGSSDSTTGGYKTNRLAWIFKVAAMEVRRSIHPELRTRRPTWNGEPVSDRNIESRTRHVVAIGTLFAVTFTAGYLTLRCSYSSDVSDGQVIFQTASAVSTVGLSMDLTGPDRPAAAKLIEIVLMLVGRLEFMAVLMIVLVCSGRVRKDAHSIPASGSQASDDDSRASDGGE